MTTFTSITVDQFKSIVDVFSSPILTVRPDFDIDEISDPTKTDFVVTYVNKTFNNYLPNVLKEGDRYSSFKLKFEREMNWQGMAVAAMKTKNPQSVTYYSTIAGKYFLVTFDYTDFGLIIIHFIDVSEAKENELQLKRQNERLAALTEELGNSRDEFKKKLSEINELNAKIKNSMYKDNLTTLPNKVKFHDDMEVLIGKSRKENKKFGLMLIDLDNLKEINDAKGREYGDKIIIRTGEVLQKFENKDIHVYRNDGDEFFVVAENIENRDRMITIGDAMLETMNLYRIKFSAGISIFKEDSENLDELQRFADMAMYNVKKHGRNNIAFFQMEMHDAFMDKINLQNKLTAAIENKVFQQFYQPQFDVNSGKLRGFEALLRWNDEELGWVSPERFVPVAEDTKQIVQIGKWVLETGIKTLKKWVESYNFSGIMSINVSPVQLKDEDFLENLLEMIKESGIETRQLEIEITEGVFIDDPNSIIKTLNKIRDAGIGISLDDFGTGYSSLSYLQKLPITTLKIDKSFIANITSKTGVEANITDSIISMVTKMGLDTIAEGVEQQEQLDILKEINCHSIQGFLKGRPMTESDCEEILKQK